MGFYFLAFQAFHTALGLRHAQFPTRSIPTFSKSCLDHFKINKRKIIFMTRNDIATEWRPNIARLEIQR